MYKLLNKKWLMTLLLGVAMAGCGNNDGGGSGGGGNGLGAGASPTLGTAGTYGVISGAAVVLNGNASIIGDLAIDPANSLTGTGTVSGTIHNGDAQAHQARLDQNAAFIDASTRVSDSVCAVSGDLLAMPPPPCGDNTGTFKPGLYNSQTTLSISPAATITLDAQGNADAVFIFQMGSALTTEPGSIVVLANGAQAKNVWWVAPAGATLGVSSIFKGTVLADTGAVTVNDSAVVEGRLFSNTAAATVETGSTITVPQ
jgi:hypothetical protein